jgi:hypothetical protein
MSGFPVQTYADENADGCADEETDGETEQTSDVGHFRFSILRVAQNSVLDFRFWIAKS